MATLRSRGPRCWQAIVRRRGWPPQHKTFEHRADALAWARLIESEMDRGVFIARDLAERTTVGELITRYGQEVSPRKRSARGDLSLVRVLLQSEIARFSVAAVDGQALAKQRDGWLAEGAAANTVRLRFALLSHCFSVAGKEWGMHLPFGNPVRLLKVPSPGRGRNRRLAPGEEEELLMRARAYGAPMPAVIELALATAMRRGELAGLRWQHIDLSRRVIHIEETKNGEPREVPLSPRALAVLRDLPRRLDGSVFGMTSGAITQAFLRITGRAAASKQTKQRQKLIPVENLRFHDLRHEAVSRLFENTDLDVMEIRAISGHKTLQMLARYTHLRTRRLAARLAGEPRGTRPPGSY